MKTKAEVLNHIKTLYAFIKNQTGFSIQILRTDNGTEFKNAETTKWVLEMGIRHETSCVYTPEQNGTAERANPTIMEMARCMLYSSNAPLWLWAEAASYAVYIRNRIPQGKREQSPFEIMYKQKPDLSPIRIFGSKVSALVPDAKRSKLESKCLKGFLVGVDDFSKGYRVFIPLKGKVIVSRDVIINETRIGFQSDLIHSIATKSFIKSTCDPFTVQEPLHEEREAIQAPELLVKTKQTETKIKS